MILRLMYSVTMAISIRITVRLLVVITVTLTMLVCFTSTSIGDVMRLIATSVLGLAMTINVRTDYTNYSYRITHTSTLPLGKKFKR